MYKRVEKIEEEKLDWREKESTLDEKTFIPSKNVNITPLKNKKRVLSNFSTLKIQNKMTKMIDTNIELSSFIGVLLLPYFVGFSIAYALFYAYAHMTIVDFLTLEKDDIIIQLWSVGAYVFITLGVFWAFAHILKRRK